MTLIAPGCGSAGISGGALSHAQSGIVLAWLIALLCICVLAVPFGDAAGQERAGSSGAPHRHQGRDRLCFRRPAGEGAGAGRRPGRAGRDRPARHAGRALVLHARDDSHDPRLARARGDVRGAERGPGRQRRHLSPLRVACGRHGARHASGGGHADPALCARACPGSPPPSKPAPGPTSKPSPTRPSVSARKSLNDAVAYIRSLAELRGRNADWGEKAVRDAATLTATAALKEKRHRRRRQGRRRPAVADRRADRSRPRPARCGSRPRGAASSRSSRIGRCS